MPVRRMTFQQAVDYFNTLVEEDDSEENEEGGNATARGDSVDNCGAEDPSSDGGSCRAKI